MATYLQVDLCDVLLFLIAFLGVLAIIVLVLLVTTARRSPRATIGSLASAIFPRWVVSSSRDAVAG